MSLVKGRQAAIQIVMFIVKLCSQAVCLTWSAANAKQDLCWSELMTTSGTWHEWINCRWGVSLNTYPCYLLTIFFFFLQMPSSTSGVTLNVHSSVCPHFQLKWLKWHCTIFFAYEADWIRSFSFSIFKTCPFYIFSVPFPLVCMIVYIHTFLWHVHLANFL